MGGAGWGWVNFADKRWPEDPSPIPPERLRCGRQILQLQVHCKKISEFQEPGYLLLV